MNQTKEEFVNSIKAIREMLTTNECAECSCPNIRCEWHGDCYNCIRIYRHFGRHVPRCLQFVLENKMARIAEVAKTEARKKPLTPDEHFNYLDAVAPKKST